MRRRRLAEIPLITAPNVWSEVLAQYIMRNYQGGIAGMQSVFPVIVRRSAYLLLQQSAARRRTGDDP